MNTSIRCFFALAVLTGCGLFCGCVSNSRSALRHSAEGYDFAIVQSSRAWTLTANDREQLRVAVAKFIEGQGLIRSGEYFVRVDFPPLKTGDPVDWVIVRLTNLPAPNFTLVASYPDEDYYYAGDRYYRPPFYGFYDFDDPLAFPFGYYSGSYFFPRSYGYWHNKPAGWDHSGHRSANHDANHLRPNSHVSFGPNQNHSGRWRDGHDNHTSRGSRPETAGSHSRGADTGRTRNQDSGRYSADSGARGAGGSSPSPAPERSQPAPAPVRSEPSGNSSAPGPVRVR